MKYKKCQSCEGLVEAHEYDTEAETCHLCIEIAEESKKAKRREYNKRYRETNRDSIRAYKKKWKKANRDLVAAQKERYLATDSGRAKQYATMTRWRSRNPDAVAKYTHKRKATKASVPSDDWTRSEVYKAAGGRCHYCKADISIAQMDADHYIPLAKGGTNLRENIVCSCKSCNRSKRDKLPSEWTSPNLIGGSN